MVFFKRLKLLLFLVFLMKLNITIVIIYYSNDIFDFKSCKSFPNKLVKELIETNDKVGLKDIEYELRTNRSINISPSQSSNNNINNNDYPITVMIVPYKNRLYNLKLFLRYMHIFLNKKRQPNEYRIFLIEPSLNNQTFNRGLLLNIGFKESIKYYLDHNYQSGKQPNCFIFHDVDMLPESDLNDYTCSLDRPKQLAVAINTYGYSTKGYYGRYFGGVNAFTRQQFESINGFSNLYFGWGAEDDDAYLRSLNKFGKIERLDDKTGRYFANCHQEQSKNSDRWTLLEKSSERMASDGLNTLKYSITKINDESQLFTHIFVKY